VNEDEDGIVDNEINDVEVNIENLVDVRNDVEGRETIIDLVWRVENLERVGEGNLDQGIVKGEVPPLTGNIFFPKVKRKSLKVEQTDEDSKEKLEIKGIDNGDHGDKKINFIPEDKKMLEEEQIKWSQSFNTKQNIVPDDSWMNLDKETIGLDGEDNNQEEQEMSMKKKKAPRKIIENDEEEKIFEVEEDEESSNKRKRDDDVIVKETVVNPFSNESFVYTYETTKRRKLND